MYLCVLCGSENKQRLFPYTALTDWFLLPRRSVFTARYGLYRYIKFELAVGFKLLICTLDKQVCYFRFCILVSLSIKDYGHTSVPPYVLVDRYRRFGEVMPSHYIVPPA